LTPIAFPGEAREDGREKVRRRRKKWRRVRNDKEEMSQKWRLGSYLLQGDLSSVQEVEREREREEDGDGMDDDK
jgi:hypothetical protein